MSSHISLFAALANELAARGHRLRFFVTTADSERITRLVGDASRDERDAITVETIEPDSVPSGTLDRMVNEMRSLGNLKSMLLQGRFDQLRYEAILEKGPALVKKSRMEALIVDQAEACSGSVGDAVGLPWISVCNGLCLNSEPLVPPFLTSWQYDETWLPVTRNRLAYSGLRLVTGRTKDLVNRYRKQWGLKTHAHIDDTFSHFAQISQQVSEFDFPRRQLPACFHYVGPIRRPDEPLIDFPWHRLDGRPLLYASLGTVLNGDRRLYRTIVEACQTLDAQLVLSLGGTGVPESFEGGKGNPVIVKFAPQRELLRHASAAITHAGLNSTLEILSQGRPIVAIPISFEQPGVAARIKWVGAGDVIPSRRLTTERLRNAIRAVTVDPAYRRSSLRIAQAIGRSGGLKQAASLIEHVVQTGKPAHAMTSGSEQMNTLPIAKG